MAIGQRGSAQYANTGAATASTLAVNIAATIQPLDIILVWFAWKSGATVVAGPAGYQAVTPAVSGSTGAQAFFWKVADGTETTATITLSAVTAIGAACVAYSGEYYTSVVPFDSLPSIAGSIQQSTTIAANPLRVNASGDMCVWFGWTGNTAGGAPNPITVPAGFNVNGTQSNTSTATVNVGVLSADTASFSTPQAVSANGSQTTSKICGAIAVALLAAPATLPSAIVMQPGGDIWRYRFYQMQNGQPGFTSEQYLFDLPLNQVMFSQILGGVGSFAAAVEMTDPAVLAALLGQPALHLLEEKTAIYVELNGALVWGGILQQASYDSLTQQTRLQGAEWWGYFENNRKITWPASYVTTDELLIAVDLVNIAQGQASSSSAVPNVAAGTVVGGNVGVQLGASAAAALTGTYTSGVALSIAWAVSSFKSVGQAVSDMGTSSVGFDWTVDVAYDSNNNPAKTFNIWYPRAGRTEQVQNATGAAIVFDLGSVSGIKYVWPSGQIQPANTFYSAGAGAGSAAIASQQADAGVLNQGWPLLEDSASFTDVSSQALLDELTLARLQARRLPVSQPIIRYAVGSDSNQPLGSFALGDDCRVIIPADPYFPAGYDSARGNYGEQWWRVQQVAVTVYDQGKSYMDVTLGLPPVIAGQ